MAITVLNFGTEIYKIAVSKPMKAVIDLRWHRLWPNLEICVRWREASAVTPAPSRLFTSKIQRASETTLLCCVTYSWNFSGLASWYSQLNHFHDNL